MSIGKTEGCLNSFGKVFAGISCFLGVMMLIVAGSVKENEMYGAGATFLVIGIVLFLICKTSVSKTMNRPTFKNAGVFLSAEQIERLEKAQDIPIVQTPVVLRPGELAIFYCEATKQETKNRVVGRTGGYGGASIRLAKGLSIHTGRTASRPIYGDVHSHFPGKFVMTTHRLVFLNGQKGFDIPYDKISSFQHYLGAIAIQSKSTTHLLLLTRPDLINALFTTIQTTGVAEFAAMMNKCYIQGDRYSLEVKYHCSCGAEVKRNMKFCPGCGDSLEFPEDPNVKIENGKVLLEGANYEDRLKDNSLKIELPDSLQMNEPVTNEPSISASAATSLPEEPVDTVSPVTNNPLVKPKKRIFMIIGAWFFGFYFAIFFIGSFGSNLRGMLGPATATGILTFMFIMLARSPKTEKYIGKLPKPIFVLICILAAIIGGEVITRLTNQTTGNEAKLQNQSNAQTTSVIKQQVESVNINNADCDQYTQNQIKQRTEPTTINNEDTKKEQMPSRKKYWYTFGGKIHNSTCQYYGKTEGVYTDGRIDKSDCQYCGGRSLPQDYDNLREVMQKRSISRNGNSD